MRISEIIKLISDSKIKIFSFVDLKKLLTIREDNTAYKIAEKLIRGKFLKRLKKGVYASNFNFPESFEIANALYLPSYISLESALNHYGILAQFPYTITSITIKKPKKFSIGNQEYEYTQIKPQLYWGFEKRAGWLIAVPEKALLDIIYLSAKGMRRISFDELDLSVINKKRFKQMCQRVNYLPFQAKLKELNLC